MVLVKGDTALAAGARWATATLVWSAAGVGVGGVGAGVVVS